MNINELELNLIERIGIDKLKLSGFAVADIHLPKLLSLTKKVEVHTSVNASRKYKRFIPDTQTGITKIVIKDNAVFSDLIIGCADIPRNIHEYVYLTITVANAKGLNLENMSYTEYDNYISCALEYINSEYGIELRADYMKVDYIEINANIFLQEQFSKYNRVLRLLMSFFHNNLGKLSTYDKLKNKKIVHEESFKRENNSVGIIFYDKIQHLKNEGVQIEEGIEILRIELRLKNRKKIDSAFDSYFWKDLNQKKIVEYFNTQIYTQLSKKFNEWQQKREKELKKLIFSCREKSSKNWHHLIMQEIRNKTETYMVPYILDIEQICSAYKKLPDPHRNVQRSIKALLNISIKDDVYKNNDIAKTYEIFGKLESYSKAISNCPQ